MKWTYKPLSVSESSGRSTTHISRVLTDVHVSLAVEVLDFIDSGL